MERPVVAGRHALAEPAVRSPNECHVVTSSRFDRLCNGPPCVLGIDEAGRGPVLGPMVYGCAVAPAHREDELRRTGVADSKALSEERRDRLLAQFDGGADAETETGAAEEAGQVHGDKGDADAEPLVAFVLRVISPTRLSTCMQQRAKYSLNDESHRTAVGLIQVCIDMGVDVQSVFVDTVGPPESYQNMLQSKFPQLQVTVSKKADSIYPIVGAASIAAKVTRDSCVRRWQFPEVHTDPQAQIDVPQGGWGSGYPGDPQTKAFISSAKDAVFGYPSFVRFSWKTCSEALDKDGRVAAVQWEDGGESGAVAAASVKSHSLHSFFPQHAAAGSPDAAADSLQSAGRRQCLFYNVCNVHNFDGPF